MAWWLILSLPPLFFVLAFVQLYLTFVVTRSIAPDVLGDVAARPAAFAALIALASTPLQFAHTVAILGPALKALLTGAEPPPPPERRRLRRHVGRSMSKLLDVGAAVIVFAGIADPGRADAAALLAVIVVGPIALARSLKGLGALRRWGWRRFTKRGYRPRHAAAEEVVGVS